MDELVLIIEGFLIGLNRSKFGGGDRLVYTIEDRTLDATDPVIRDRLIDSLNELLTFSEVVTNGLVTVCKFTFRKREFTLKFTFVVDPLFYTEIKGKHFMLMKLSY